MSAIVERRARRTLVGAVLALVLTVVASTMFAVGVFTLANSKEGEAVGVDDRAHVALPATPNAVLAVTDERGELASLVVMTLLPQGQGGSIVTFPVNADSTAGFGLQRRPIDESFDATDLEALVVSVEEMLAITVQRAEVVDAEGLAALLPTTQARRLVLPNDVIDTDGGGGRIAEAGPQTLTLEEMTGVLAAIDDDASPDADHANDVAVWESLAQIAPAGSTGEVPLDDLGRPIAPRDVDELMARLWQGTVSVRDLTVVPVVDAENPTGADVVLIDRRDAALVFAQVSPGLVSTPNTGTKARIVANFTPEQLATADGLYDSTSDLAVELIGRLVFLSGNVVSVDTAPTGVPAVTIIEVFDERQLQETIDAADALIGEAEVRVSEKVIDGVDVNVILGMSYLEHEMARSTSTAPASEATTVTTEPTTDSSLGGSTSSSGVEGTVADDG